MSTPFTGAISLVDVRNELNPNQQITSMSLGDTAIRGLANVSSGAISLGSLRGKNITFAANVTFGGVASSMLSPTTGYWNTSGYYHAPNTSKTANWWIEFYQTSTGIYFGLGYSGVQLSMYCNGITATTSISSSTHYISGNPWGLYPGLSTYLIIYT